MFLQLKLVDFQMLISMTENVSGVMILLKMSFISSVIVLCTVIEEFLYLTQYRLKLETSIPFQQKKKLKKNHEFK